MGKLEIANIIYNILINFIFRKKGHTSCCMYHLREIHKKIGFKKITHFFWVGRRVVILGGSFIL